jgi:putative ABC transport system permease protein
MLQYHLRTTLNYFRNHRSFLFLNLTGLTIGLTAFYFAFIYASFELSYDSFHEKADKTYRLVVDVKTANGIDYRGTPPPLAPTVKMTFPEIEAATRILLDYLILQNESGVQSEEKIGYADATVFSVFSFPLTQGDPKEALNAPLRVVLSETTAAKYFGNKNPIGRTLIINGRDHAFVTGVMKDIPHNSHLQFDVLVSIATLFQDSWNPTMEHNWRSRRANSYVVLSPGADPVELNTRITRLLSNNIERENAEFITSLEPLRDVYLHGKPRGSRSGSAITGNATNVYICALVGALVLLIAGMNYVNLSTAFSMQRAREIGVRKIMGASRLRLASQFLSDAIVLSVIAFMVSLGLIALLTRLFNEMCGKVVSVGFWEHPYYLCLLFVASVVTGFLSGLYPSFFLSAFEPIDTMKGRFTSGQKGIMLRKILVTSQFLTSFILIVATTVLYQQLHFMQNQDLGFRKDHMLAIDFQFDKVASSEITRNQLLQIPGVSMVSVSSSLPGRANVRTETKIQDVHDAEEWNNMDAYFVDYNFMQQYGLKVIAGRDFSSLIASDSTQAMIVNEAAVKYLGYPNAEAILDKRYEQIGRKGVVVGVIKDFHFQSFREEVQPLTFQIGELLTFMTLTVSGVNTPMTISMIERKWKSIVPDMPISYFFTDEAYHAQYDNERRFGQLFICLVSIAIVISCLGLFGLSVFNTTQRTKEIGIRKVLGSSSFKIVTLLARDFLLLVAIGIVVGVPLSWYAMNQWLEEFAYRIDLSVGTFVSAALVLVIIAIATVCLQTVRAANVNPVKSLRTE